MTDSMKRRTRKSFSEELKREAATLFECNGGSANQMSTELGVST